MIISHKNKFVFFKPMKVAGSSVEVALSKECGEEDILTGTNHLDEISSSEYDYPVRNNMARHRLKNEVALAALSQSGNIHRVTPEMIKSGVFVEVLEPRFHMHAFPDQVFSRYERDLSTYKKITIVRNPWDMIVSFFWWSFYTSPSGYVDSNGIAYENNVDPKFSITSHPEAAPTSLDDAETLSRKLEIFCQLSGDFNGPNGKEKNQNIIDWFIGTSKKFYQIDYDFILRQESLQSDYDKMCQSLDISQSKIPRLKSNQRKAKLQYQDYYNSWTRNLIDEKVKMWIDKFGYSF